MGIQNRPTNKHVDKSRNQKKKKKNQIKGFTYIHTYMLVHISNLVFLFNFWCVWWTSRWPFVRWVFSSFWGNAYVGCSYHHQMEGNLHANKLANFGVTCNSLTCDHMLVVKFNPLSRTCFLSHFLIKILNYKQKQTNWDKKECGLNSS